jgi:hypothetical protein
VEELQRLSGETGYNDVFVFAPVPAVIEQGDAILAFDGCRILLQYFTSINIYRIFVESTLFNQVNKHVNFLFKYFETL